MKMPENIQENPNMDSSEEYSTNTQKVSNEKRNKDLDWLESESRKKFEFLTTQEKINRLST